MKIFEVINSLGAGGAENLLKDLAIGFKKEGHDVVVISLDAFSDDISEIKKTKQLEESGILVHSLKRKPGSRSFKPLLEIDLLLKEHKPNVIHIHSFLAGLYFSPFTFTKKYLFFETVHSTQILHSNLQKIVYKKIYKNKFSRIFCSQESRINLHESIGDGVVIDNGIGRESFINICDDLKKEFKIPEDSLIGLNVGRITKAKNQLLLIDLVEELNQTMYHGNFYLLICGKHTNDQLYDKINQKLKTIKYSNNVKFTGVRNDIIDLMHSVDFYISTSIFEGLPITVLEAINTGVPIILSPISEHKNVFGNVEGCYFPLKNSIESYQTLFQNLSNIKEMSKTNLINKRTPIIEKYSIDRTVINYLNYFQKK